MIKQQIDEILVIINLDAVLVPDKGEIIAEIHQERTDIFHYGHFELRFRMFIFQSRVTQKIVILQRKSGLLFDGVGQSLIKIGLPHYVFLVRVEFNLVDEHIL